MTTLDNEKDTSQDIISENEHTSELMSELSDVERDNSNMPPKTLDEIDTMKEGEPNGEESLLREIPLDIKTADETAEQSDTDADTDTDFLDLSDETADEFETDEFETASENVPEDMDSETLDITDIQDIADIVESEEETGFDETAEQSDADTDSDESTGFLDLSDETADEFETDEFETASENVPEDMDSETLDITDIQDIADIVESGEETGFDEILPVADTSDSDDIHLDMQDSNNEIHEDKDLVLETTSENEYTNGSMIELSDIGIDNSNMPSKIPDETDIMTEIDIDIEESFLREITLGIKTGDKDADEISGKSDTETDFLDLSEEVLPDEIDSETLDTTDLQDIAGIDESKNGEEPFIDEMSSETDDSNIDDFHNIDEGQDVSTEVSSTITDEVLVEITIDDSLQNLTDDDFQRIVLNLTAINLDTPENISIHTLNQALDVGITVPVLEIKDNGEVEEETFQEIEEEDEADRVDFLTQYTSAKTQGKKLTDILEQVKPKINAARLQKSGKQTSEQTSDSDAIDDDTTEEFNNQLESPLDSVFSETDSNEDEMIITEYNIQSETEDNNDTPYAEEKIQSYAVNTNIFDKNNGITHIITEDEIDDDTISIFDNNSFLKASPLDETHYESIHTESSDEVIDIPNIDIPMLDTLSVKVDDDIINDISQEFMTDSEADDVSHINIPMLDAISVKVDDDMLNDISHEITNDIETDNTIDTESFPLDIDSVGEVYFSDDIGDIHIDSIEDAYFSDDTHLVDIDIHREEQNDFDDEIIQKIEHDATTLMTDDIMFDEETEKKAFEEIIDTLDSHDNQEPIPMTVPVSALQKEIHPIKIESDIASEREKNDLYIAQKYPVIETRLHRVYEEELMIDYEQDEYHAPLRAQEQKYAHSVTSSLPKSLVPLIQKDENTIDSIVYDTAIHTTMKSSIIDEHIDSIYTKYIKINNTLSLIEVKMKQLTLQTKNSRNIIDIFIHEQRI